ncbi:MAG: ribonuclease PH [Alphaproteobacteria bacterium]|jgi:ribonuclease PH
MTNPSNRPSQRNFDQLRDVTFELDYAPQAEGSCLIKYGNTHVLCTATIEDKIPPFLKGKGEGWVTAEYGMLPRSTGERMGREAARGKQSGRTQEIQRLIGRSLRAVTDLKALGEKQIIIDCDVIRADGGTRTAAITGGYIALFAACAKAAKEGRIKSMPITKQVAAISCGIYKDKAVLDLDYIEDSNAQADANFILTETNQIIEIQATAEDKPFSDDLFQELFVLARKGIKELTAMQAKIITEIMSCK